MKIENVNISGKYTPEAACEHPGAVRQLALEFARAGGDVTQTFTYGSTEGDPHKIEILSLDQNPNFLHFSLGMLEGCRFTPEQINQAACDIAKQVLGQDIVSKRTTHPLEFFLRSMAFP